MEIHFIGLLTGAGSSLLNVELEHGFEFSKYSSNEIFDLLRQINWNHTGSPVPPFEFINFEECCMMAITNTFDADLEFNEDGRTLKTFYDEKYIHFHNELINNYLRETLCKMRLYHEGSLFMPTCYCFTYYNGIPKQVGGSGYIEQPKRVVTYSLIETDYLPLSELLVSVSIPLSQSYLELSRGTIDLSYLAPTNEVSFLILMMGVETIFNRGQGEITYSVSRDVGVLLGDTDVECRTIQKKVKELYRKRSGLIHSGKAKDGVSNEDVRQLRDYLRQSIIIINKLNIDDSQLHDYLDASGFGYKSWQSR